MSGSGGRSKTLAFFISSLAPGGAERICATLANYWANAGWEITLITLSGPETDFYTLDSRIRRVSLRRIQASRTMLGRFRNNLDRVTELRAALRAARPSIALSSMDRNNVLLALASRGQGGLICIGTEHIHPPQSSPGAAWSTLRRLFYGDMWAIVALTDKSAQWISSNTRAARVRVIPNAVSWPVPSTEPRLVPPVKRGGRLLCVGRLHAQKGFDLLLPSFSQLASRFNEWDLVILGEGEGRSELEKIVAQLNLNHRVHLPGVAGNIDDWYATADIFVMPSRYEGFPMTLLEAMAYGIPPVSFDCDTGPGEIIRHGYDGVIVPNGNTERLGTELGLLMANSEYRSRLAKHALEVRSRFSVEAIAAMWESLFDEALNAGSR